MTVNNLNYFIVLLYARSRGGTSEYAFNTYVILLTWQVFHWSLRNCDINIVFKADNYKCLFFQHLAKYEIPCFDMYLHKKSSSSNGEISSQIQVWWAWSIGMSRMMSHKLDAEVGLAILKLRTDCNDKYFR